MKEKKIFYVVAYDQLTENHNQPTIHPFLYTPHETNKIFFLLLVQLELQKLKINKTKQKKTHVE